MINFLINFLIYLNFILFYRWLRIESQLLELDAQIKSNLGLDKANADQCLQAMDVMLNLSIDPLMLKKHPQIVETIKRVSEVKNVHYYFPREYNFFY